MKLLDGPSAGKVLNIDPDDYDRVHVVRLVSAVVQRPPDGRWRRVVRKLRHIDPPGPMYKTTAVVDVYDARTRRFIKTIESEQR